MIKKNSLNFIRAFLCSIVIASPFLIRQIPYVKEKLSPGKKHYAYLEEPNDSPETPEKPSTDNSASNTNNSNENPIEKPEEKTLSFETVTNSYFDDALLIGDSRTVGIQKYGDLKNATRSEERRVGKECL